MPVPSLRHLKNSFTNVALVRMLICRCRRAALAIALAAELRDLIQASTFLFRAVEFVIAAHLALTCRFDERLGDMGRGDF